MEMKAAIASWIREKWGECEGMKKNVLHVGRNALTLTVTKFKNKYTILKLKNSTSV